MLAKLDYNTARSQPCTVVIIAALVALQIFLSHSANAQFRREVAPFSVLDTDGAPFAQPFFGGFDRPIPQLVDIDGDGDLDLFVQEDDEELRFFENTGTPQEHAFDWRSDRFSDLAGEWFHFFDLDQDGDQDLLIGANFNEIVFLENLGSATVPAFNSTPVTVRDNNGQKVLSDPPMLPAVVDVDCNGSLDLFLGQQDGTIHQLELEAFSAAGPTFRLVTTRFQNIEVSPSAVGNTKDERHGANAQAFFDVDQDGDLDLYYGDFFERSVLYFRNDGSCTEIDMDRVADSVQTGPADYFLTTGYNVPTPADLNGDGAVDLVVGTLNENFASLVENLFYLKNEGGNFTLEENRLVDGLDVGSISAPTVGDVDHDGLNDIIVGSSLVSGTRSGLALFLQSSDLGGATYNAEGYDFLELDLGFNYSPTFADLDGDGLEDLVIGRFDGKLTLLNSTELPPYFEIQELEFEDIDIGSNATPTFGDTDGDGDLDLVVGESTGTINYFENTGTRTSAIFDSGVTTFAGIDVGQSSRPLLVDWDGDLDLDVLIGGNYKGLLLALNIGSPESFVLDAPVALDLDAGFLASATATDIDADGDIDLLTGDQAGGLRFFRNTEIDTAIEPEPTSLIGLIDSIYPNPISGGDVGFTTSRPSAFHVVLNEASIGGRAVIVTVFDLLGRRLVREIHQPLDQPITVRLNGTVPPGLLLVRVEQGSASDTGIVVKH